MCLPPLCLLNIMLYCMRRQVFLNGNKRIAILAANIEMIVNGAGVIIIPVRIICDFTQLLIRFYETGVDKDIKGFVYNYCIDGIDC